MPVPKFRTSASKRDMRRSHHALKAPGISLCSNCGSVRRPHCMCGSCGFYKGKQVVSTGAADTAFGSTSTDTSFGEQDSPSNPS